MRREFTVSPMGERALLICFANRLSPSVNAQVHRANQLISEANLPGVQDLVPAYTSLLVTFDPQVAAPTALTKSLHQLLAQSSDMDKVSTLPSGARHIVPVQYGDEAGEDLEEVARFHNLTVAEVVRYHAGREYHVNFLGFLPGFAYLSKLSPRIMTPRLPTPRARVPQGSVGIGAGQTAIYPVASPGGWRIIGRTSYPVWDVHAEVPARLQPGDRVRFVPSKYEPLLEESEARQAKPHTPALEVLAVAGITTVQDLGRPGLAHLGVSMGGAFDAFAAIRANALAGNPPEAALLEMSWNGPHVRALRNIVIALDGADLGCRVDGAPIPTGLSWFVRQGSEIRFAPERLRRGGVRGYLALSGGLDVPTVLGSRSTSMLAHFGGYAGRPLAVGDVLGVCRDRGDAALVAGRYWLGKTAALPPRESTLRLTLFRGRGEASASARQEFKDRVFVLTDRADRMGSRFTPEDGTPLPTGSRELISFGVVQGAIQLPPDGNPVVLNVDHQTTGGYPILGVVIAADWSTLAQLVPGDEVRFEVVSVEEALAAQLAVLSDLDRGLRLLGQRLSAAGD